MKAFPMSFMKEEELEAEEDPFFLNLHIRTATGERQEFVIRVEATATVDQFKQQIRQSLRISEDQNLRLIYNGKLLGPDSCTVESTDLKNNAYVHAVISPKPSSSISSNTPQVFSTSTSSESGDAVVVERRGLNSLLLSVEGDARQRLSLDDVNALRAYFSSSIQEYTERYLTRGAEESEEEFSFRAESEWMAAQPLHSEFRLNLNIAATHALFRSAAGGGTGGMVFLHMDQSDVPDRSQEVGTVREFFFGLAMGYTLGFMMIFCVWDNNVSYRQKLGILAGVILQMLLTKIWQNQQKTSSDSNNSGSLRGSSDAGSSNSPIL